MRSLYRGFDKKLESTVHVNIFHRSPRTPRQTDMQVHEYSDEWFSQKFGIKARSFAVICSTDIAQARSYGATYRIIANEPFAIIYSPLVRDFLEHEIELASESKEDVWAWLEKQQYEIVTEVEKIKPKFLGEVMLCCGTFSTIPC